MQWFDGQVNNKSPFVLTLVNLQPSKSAAGSAKGQIATSCFYFSIHKSTAFVALAYYYFPPATPTTTTLPVRECGRT